MRTNYVSKFKPINEDKYIGNIDNITCRSSWERKFAMFLDKNKNVKSWGSETHKVKYFFPVDNKYHTYFIDFFIELEDRKLLIEIKPEREKHPPILSKSNRKTPRYKKAQYTYAKNMCKWRAAKEVASQYGYEFEIWSEVDLKKIGIFI